MEHCSSVLRLKGMRSPGTAPTPPPTSAEHLPDDPATLKRLIVELLASLQECQRDKAALQHRLDLLLRRLYGPRGERFDPNQPLLFPEVAAGPDTPAAGPDTTAAEPKPKRRCKPHGRRRLPANLPREARHHELTQAERLCPGCGRVRVDIGVDTSEQLDYRPASLFVVEHFVHKYACPCCRLAAAAVAGPPEHAAPEAAPLTTPAPEPPPVPEPAASGPAATGRAAEPAPTGPEPTDPSQPSYAVVIAAAKPAMPIAKGLPGPGLLAHLIVSKYTDHLPLYRLEHIYERQGLFIHRSTLCGWLAASAALLRPLYDLLARVVLQSQALHTDDTPVKMQEPRTHLLSTARFWAYLGDAAHPYNVFDFTPNRKRDGPQQFLANYQGYLHADAFSGYDGLYLPDPQTAAARITEVACNAHARRKFYDARSSDALRAHQALAYYGQLYVLEERARQLNFTDAQRLQMRQDLAVPILETFHQWLEAQRPEVLPKSPLGEALGYALNNWTALVRYTEAGFLDIDNNVAEREMKRVALGRKNWLFVGSPQGGRTAAVLLSFTSTCHRLGVEPWAYLQDVLTRLPVTPAERLADLLPDHWQAARPALTTTAPTSPTDPTASSAAGAS
jgi:transposase